MVSCLSWPMMEKSCTFRRQCQFILDYHRWVYACITQTADSILHVINLNDIKKFKIYKLK